MEVSFHQSAVQSGASVESWNADIRLVVDTIPTLAWSAGPDGSAEFFNQRWLAYTGLSAKQALGSGWKVAIHPDDLNDQVDYWRRVVAAGQPGEIEGRLRRSDGVYRWFLFRASPSLDENGGVVKWYGTNTDIEDRKRAEERMRNENLVLREQIDQAFMFEEIVGTSSALQRVLSRLMKVAPTDSSVLVLGETGTGKELVARAIHKRSRRSQRPFVSVNCAAVPRDLILSELFGHEKGAFTGATQRRLGRFELANGGTIFLDEVGELALDTQIALLRVLQEREFERVGGTGPIRTNVRVIAATNRDLETAITSASFRSDLFYRLNVFPIEIPSLRERRDDIPLLVEYFLDRYARKAGKNFRAINKKSLELLQSHSWPGNIRELQNVIERSVIVCDCETFSVDESWISLRPIANTLSRELYPSKSVSSYERETIEGALSECEGRVSGPFGAADKLGIPRSTLESKIQALKINKNQFKV
jgi:PAS domain S-box-containing protein